MMKKHYRIFALLAFASLPLASCDKEIVGISQKPTTDKEIDPKLVYKRPTTAKEISLVENLGKVTTIFKELYQTKANLNVVNAAINSRTYTDESVLLKDLIYPEGSLVTDNPRFKAYARKHNLSLTSFASSFWAIANKANDQAFLNFLNSLKPADSATATKGKAKGALTTDADGVSVYFPYSQQFMIPYEEEGGGGEYSYGPVTSLVTATADADAGYGYQPYTDSYGVTQYQTVVVDDDFAYNNPTHIIGLNGIEPYLEPTTSNSTAFEPTGPIVLPGATREIKQVYVGEVRCTHQFDALISFTDNGGGSEIRFTRADGFLKIADGQVQADVYSGGSTINRYNIRKKRWVTFGQEWDSDWEATNNNENLATFEDDNRNEFTLTGSISTTLTFSPGNTGTGTIGFEKVFRGDDRLERQHNLVRDSFFALNRIDLEGEMINRWPARDRSARISYTLWDRTYTR